MTTPQSIKSQVRHAEPVATAATRDALPYAQPTIGALPGAVDAVLIDAIRASAGPYIPAPWRSPSEALSEPVFIQQVKPSVLNAAETSFGTAPLHVPHDVMGDTSGEEYAANAADSADSSAELPWINAFLDAPADELTSVATETFSAASNTTSFEKPLQDAAEYDVGEAIEKGVENSIENSVENSVEGTAQTSVEEVGEAHSDVTSSPSFLFADDTAELPSVAEMLRIEQPVEFVDAASDDALNSTDAPVAQPADDVESWPMAEAGDAMRALADDFVAKDLTKHANADDMSAIAGDDGHVGADADAGSLSESGTPGEPAPLPMWSDDDMMDIMPVAVTRNSGEPGHWATQARQDDESAGSGEAVAQVLESLARRARDGELPVHGYSSEMGDAAVLAAALASLLGVRR